MERLKLGAEVGKGAYGTVYRSQWRAPDGAQARQVAVKCIKQPKGQHDGVPHNACREFGLLKELDHTNVVRLHEVLVDVGKKELNVVMEWAEFDLSLVFYTHYQMNPPHPMALSMIKAIMFQVQGGGGGRWSFVNHNTAAARRPVHALAVDHAPRYQARQRAHHR